jgi:dihydrofolate reductase
VSKVKVAPFSVSLDGFGAGPRQDLQNPIGVRGLELHAWVFETETFQKMISQNAETREMETFKKMTSQRAGARGIDTGTGIDNDFMAASFENVGAYIIGRNMFGPVRGPWRGMGKDEASGESWKGWWGANPPFHAPVFVLTHHARASLEMEGGTTFHFITDGLDSALSKAKAAANGKEIRIGGVSVIRQYLISGQIDEMHLAVSPVLLGEGEALFHGINLHQLGYKPVKVVAGENATHVIIKKS